MKSKSLLFKIQYVLMLFYFIQITAYSNERIFNGLIYKIVFVLLFGITLLIEKFKLKITKNTKWLLMFWGYYFLSFLWTSNSIDTKVLLTSAISLLGVSIVMNSMIKTKDDVIIILKLYLMAMLYSVIALLINTPFEAWGTERMGMGLGLNSNSLGVRLVAATAIALYLLAETIKDTNYKSRKIKILYYTILSGLFFIVTLYTGSKKALFGLLFCIVAYQLIKAKGFKVLFKGGIIIFFVILTFYLIFNNENLYNVLGNRIELMINTMVNENVANKDTSYITRKFYIDKGVELFKKHPILGYGGNTFINYMREINFWHVAYSHNNFIEVLSTLGIIGFSIYYGFLICLIWKLFCAYKNNGERHLLLLLTVLTTNLLMDFGMVSYYDEFISCIINISYLAYSINLKKVCK